MEVTLEGVAHATPADAERYAKLWLLLPRLLLPATFQKRTRVVPRQQDISLAVVQRLRRFYERDWKPMLDELAVLGVVELDDELVVPVQTWLRLNTSTGSVGWLTVAVAPNRVSAVGV